MSKAKEEKSHNFINSCKASDKNQQPFIIKTVSNLKTDTEYLNKEYLQNTIQLTLYLMVRN